MLALRCPAVLIMVLLSLSPVAANAARNWTDHTGKYQIKADIVRVDAQSVTLLKSDGRTVTLKHTQLAAKDAEYLDKLVVGAREADSAFYQGAEALSNELFVVAEPRFREASKLDPLSIKADFLLGILRIGLHRDFEAAEKHFQICISRWKPRIEFFTESEKANYAAVLNNLALAKLRRNKPAESIRLWQDAIKLQDQTPQEIIQNLGTFAAFSRVKSRDASPANIYLSAGVHRRVNTLISQTKLGPSTKPYEAGQGWFYMTYVESRREEQPTPSAGSDTTQQPPNVKVDATDPNHAGLVKIGSGTGFVVAEGHILTNRHVVMSDAGVLYDGFKVFVGPDYKQPRVAKLRGYSRAHDLALLKVEGLNQTKIALLNDLPPLGEDVVSVGFPSGDDFGLGITMTQGSVAKHPVDNVGNTDPKRGIKRALWHDSKINSGSSGGPLISKGGVAVGVNFATFNPGMGDAVQADFAENYGLAVPSSEAVKFIRFYLPQFQGTDNLQAKIPLQQLKDSVSFIEILGKPVLAKMPRNEPSSGRAPEVTANDHAFRDIWCLACDGTQKLRCTRTGCKGGVIRSTRNVSVRKNTPLGFVDVVEKRPVRSQCPSCRARGFVDCPYSILGVDKRFLVDSRVALPAAIRN